MRRTTMTPLDAVVAGHICLDIIPTFASAAGRTDVLRPGTLVKVGPAVLSTGGAVSNTGIVLRKLGARVALIGAVGRDFFGEGVRAIVRERVGDDTGMKVVRDGSTSYTVVLAVPGTDRIFLHHPGTNDTFGYDDIDFNLVRRARLFHLGYPTLMRRLYLNEGAELVRIYRRVKELGVATSLDMALPDPASEAGKVRWNRILEQLMPYVDVFLPSFEEIVFMADRPRYERLKRASRSGDPMETMEFTDAAAVAQQLIAWGGSVVVVKCSVRGLYLRTAGADRIAALVRRTGIRASAWTERELIGASFKVRRIASATGSGDSAIAGFLRAVLAGLPPEAALRCANAAGAQNLRAYDAVSGVGSWASVLRMARAGAGAFNDPGVSGWRCIAPGVWEPHAGRTQA